MGSVAAPPSANEIWGYDVVRRVNFPVKGDYKPPRVRFNSQVSGNVVVWYDKRGGKSRIYARRLSGGSELRLRTLRTTWWVDPVVSGNVVVFPDKRNGSWNIYGYDLKKRKEFPICTAAGNQTSPDVSGNLVAWCDTRGGGSLRARLLGGKEFTIASSSTSAPSISGSTVVWSDRTYGDATIYRATVTR